MSQINRHAIRIIAIDGPAGAGKSTVAQRVAAALGYLYIDSGAMYRAVTWLALKKGINVHDPGAVLALTRGTTISLKPGDASLNKAIRVFANDEDVTAHLRTQEIDTNVSYIAVIPQVRAYIDEQQRALAAGGKIVIDGRDIGTVVFPDADLKIFLTASAPVRAHRREAELKAKGQARDYKAILKEIIERDHIDSNRDIATLRMADDAVLILTDNMTIEQVVSHIVNLCT